MQGLRIFQSDDSLLIRGLLPGDVELTRDEARQLVDALLAVIDPPATTRRYRKLSAEERAEFERLYEAGATGRQIADHFGLSKNSVAVMRLRFGIPARDQARGQNTISGSNRPMANGQIRREGRVMAEALPTAPSDQPSDQG